MPHCSSTSPAPSIIFSCFPSGLKKKLDKIVKQGIGHTLTHLSFSQESVDSTDFYIVLTCAKWTSLHFYLHFFIFSNIYLVVQKNVTALVFCVKIFKWQPGPD